MSAARLHNMRPVPIEVADASGRWHPGFLLLAFNADGTVTVRSRKTGAVRQLDQTSWRDPVELDVMARHGLTPAVPGAHPQRP